MDVEGRRNNRPLGFYSTAITEHRGASGLSSHCHCKSVSWSVVGPVVELQDFSASCVRCQSYLSHSRFQHAAENGKLLEVASFAGKVLNV